MRKVLSIDGGGIRGIIPAMVLAEIERRTGKRTAEVFDLVALGESSISEPRSGRMFRIARESPG
jgi:patatin-like phospholipase/acyl hydrolase